jgi:hypothetical protein
VPCDKREDCGHEAIRVQPSLEREPQHLVERAIAVAHHNRGSGIERYVTPVARSYSSTLGLLWQETGAEDGGVGIQEFHQGVLRVANWPNGVGELPKTHYGRHDPAACFRNRHGDVLAQ